jgi:hypothetical protein
MDDPANVALQKVDAGTVPVRAADPSSFTIWFTSAGLVVLVTTGVFFYGHEGARLARAGPAVPVMPATTERPLGPEVEAIELPPLDSTDALVRRLVSSLSSHPRVLTWLATGGLIRNFVVGVENISMGRSPAARLRALRPAAPFRPTQRGEDVVVDPASYDRYRPLAGAVESIDPQEAARVYATLKPRLEDAYRELGHPGSFDRALERAIVELLKVPVLEGNAVIVPKGALYIYEERGIERLTAAQKQVERLGPQNVRIIQAKLGEFARALGIQADRLPRFRP